ncbi:D-glycero-beta-D-manno-heptose 1,7-bisphosphate 7-phosphatase [Limnohabitans sp. T6-20]|uniref:D-glycero-alpha-D-manno-heptose-1,7-bisphosphate 7-phosphatase n=1 Tax=Limnohabitans sp. T6-20 TaxID=1100725 RepID=UPI000D3B1F1D|nr:HAD family hydrolase [Limnohabitans sp. T6-20]PUE09762.1 D,D-heptose 1,7-bisphosphate phosphatase [Limnohabitans sp. T6-20]
MNTPLRRALFLDRDGVINHDSGYTSTIAQFSFIDGIFELAREAVRRDYLLIVVTNQAGIGRGYYTEQDFRALTDWMCEQFREQGAPITDVFHCPFHPEHGIGQYRRESEDRKPNPGMLISAARKHGIDLSLSAMVGDKDTDMLSALNAGVATRIHFADKGASGDVSTAATYTATSLWDCVTQL